MFIAILSDIHGNAAALAAVLEHLDADQIETLAVLGDCVGYYYQPSEVYALLEPWPCLHIRGNHEDLLASYHDGDDELRLLLRSKYGHGFEACLEQLGPERLEWMGRLPAQEQIHTHGISAFLCHGSPDDPDAYVYPDTPTELIESCGREGFDFVFQGHTHIPMSYRAKQSLVINPGSVGQSRLTGGIAQWGLLNLETKVYQARCTPYSTDDLVGDCEAKDPEVPFLRDVLRRVRGMRST